jgi:hypothetical protein
LICRRASPFEATRPALTKAASSTPSRRLELGARNLDGRQALGERAFLEGLRAVSAALLARRAAVQQRGRLGREHLLGLVDLGALQRREPRDLVQRQVVNSFRKRPTSASSVLRQNCQ